MPLLSVAIICKDNAATIGRTLDSVRDLDPEIVAADSGSTDATLSLLESVTARIIRTPWLGFIATKQLALDACTGDWVLSLDSDESLLPDLREAIRRTINQSAASQPPAHGYLVNRKVFYRNLPLNHAWQPEHRLRLIRRTRARWTGLDPHDRLELLTPGPTPLLPGDLRHDSISTFTDFLAKQATHARTMAASMHARGHRGSVLHLLASPPGALLKQLIIKQAWRDGWPGWLAAASTAAATLMKHAALIEIDRGCAQTAAPPPNRGSD